MQQQTTRAAEGALMESNRLAPSPAARIVACNRHTGPA